MSLPWIEKYRPQTLDDVVGNKSAIDRFKVLAVNGNIPNMILTGPPGTGKTTSLLCLCRQLLNDKMKTAFLELNASDERGINVVREYIKDFAKTKVDLPEGRHKIVLLDESDAMTDAAQQAMRRTMEIFSNTTRFVFACNQSEKVIEPIQSRCAVVRFAPVDEGEVAVRLEKICELEGVKYESEGINAIARISEGDMRVAINALQSTFFRTGFISQENVLSTVDVPNPNAIKDVFQSILEDDIRKSITILNTLVKKGHNYNEIVKSMFSTCRRMEMEEKLKLEFLKEIGLTQLTISQGSASLIQLTGLVGRLYKRCH